MSEAPRTPLALSFEELKAVFVELMDAVRQHVANRVDPLSARLDSMNNRVAGVEDKFVIMQDERLRYRGQYSRAEAYPQSDLVTYNGALWCTIKPSKGNAPGDGNGDWLLMAKSVQPDAFSQLERRVTQLEGPKVSDIRKAR
jgi:hypothetical protein